jgi:(S)-citramalyl-CoA lyase
LSSSEFFQPRRTFIFAPALNPDMYSKALRSGSDIVCVELEDGVAPKDKDQARKNAIAIFGNEEGKEDRIERVLRINCVRSEVGLSDVQAIISSDTPPPVIMMPKVLGPEEVVWLDDLLTERGHATRLHVIIETCQGLENVTQIARASKRLDALFFGGFDMAAELRCEMAWQPLLYARSRLVHAAASEGLDAIDVPYLDLNDEVGMQREADLSKALGFSGKGAIHPRQIPILKNVFTPSSEELKYARQIVDAFMEADTGLLVIDGKLIEKPVIREMQRRLSLAKKYSPCS